PGRAAAGRWWRWRRGVPAPRPSAAAPGAVPRLAARPARSRRRWPRPARRGNALLWPSPLQPIVGAVDPLATLEAVIVACRACPRMVAWREQVARTKRAAFRDDDYWGRPVPGFGDPAARVCLVGLAPAAHGANRTGRMFTGDRSGDFLYAALWRT